MRDIATPRRFPRRDRSSARLRKTIIRKTIVNTARNSARRRPAIGIFIVALILIAAAAGANAENSGATPLVEIAQDQNAPATPDASKPATPAEPAAPPPPPGAPPKNLQPIFPGDATSILGKKVQGAAGEDMGRVVDILVDGEGQPRAAVIDFGGFLGVGSRKIAVDWRLLQFRPTDRKAPMQLSVTRAEVQAAPEYKEKNEPTQVVGPPAEAPAAPDAAK